MLKKQVNSFTDEDLKRWKDRGDLVGFDGEVMRLIARLEAAENFIGGRTVICSNCENVVESTETEEALYKAWRNIRGEIWDGNNWVKAAGKDGR